MLHVTQINIDLPSHNQLVGKQVFDLKTNQIWDVRCQSLSLVLHNCKNYKNLQKKIQKNYKSSFVNKGTFYAPYGSLSGNLHELEEKVH